MTDDRCPECGRSLGTLMQTHDDQPGVFEILRGEAGEAARVAVILALCVLAALAYVCARAVVGF